MMKLTSFRIDPGVCAIVDVDMGGGATAEIILPLMEPRVRFTSLLGASLDFSPSAWFTIKRDHGTLQVYVDGQIPFSLKVTREQVAEWWMSLSGQSLPDEGPMCPQESNHGPMVSGMPGQYTCNACVNAVSASVDTSAVPA